MSSQESETELVTPLVNATPVAVEEDVSVLPVSVPAATANPPKKRVSVVVPSVLPPGYRLPIKYREGGNACNGYCRVPEGGAMAGQEIEAEIIPAQAVNGNWAVGPFDCGSMRDGWFAFLSCYCAPVAWGCLYESAFKKPSGSCWLVLLVLTVICHVCYLAGVGNQNIVEGGENNVEEGDVISFTVSLISWAIIITVTVIRARIRQKYQIPGNYCVDCLCTTFFGCCTAIQSYQHMERAQENPRFTSSIQEQEATLIV